MRKIQTQGVHHITLVGADRQTSIDFWEGVLGMPFVFERPNLDNESGEPPLLRPGRRAPDHGLHRRGTRGDRHDDGEGARPRPPPGLQRLAGDFPSDGGAARRARLPPQRRQGPWLHGFDLLRRSAQAADRARVLPIRVADGLHACRGAARGAQAARRAGRLQHRAGAPRRRDRGADQAVARVTVRRSRSEGSLPAGRSTWLQTS